MPRPPPQPWPPRLMSTSVAGGDCPRQRPRPPRPWRPRPKSRPPESVPRPSRIEPGRRRQDLGRGALWPPRTRPPSLRCHGQILVPQPDGQCFPRCPPAPQRPRRAVGRRSRGRPSVCPPCALRARPLRRRDRLAPSSRGKEPGPACPAVLPSPHRFAPSLPARPRVPAEGKGAGQPVTAACVARGTRPLAALGLAHSLALRARSASAELRSNTPPTLGRPVLLTYVINSHRTAGQGPSKLHPQNLHK